jgi:hypothetical protein
MYSKWRDIPDEKQRYAPWTLFFFFFGHGPTILTKQIYDVSVVVFMYKQKVGTVTFTPCLYTNTHTKCEPISSIQISLFYLVLYFT